MLSVGNQKDCAVKEKTDVRQGTLALMVLKTLDVLGALHGYGIGRRVSTVSRAAGIVGRFFTVKAEDLR